MADPKPKALPLFEVKASFYALLLKNVVGTTAYPSDPGYAPFELDSALVTAGAAADTYILNLSDGSWTVMSKAAFEAIFTLKGLK